MGLLKKLFGGDPAKHAQKGKQHEDAGAHGEAKLAYERALAATDESDGEARAAHQASIDRCRDAIARGRMAEAEVFQERGDIDFAREELAGAKEVAADPALRDECQTRIDVLERREVLSTVQHEEELSDEDRITLLAANWSDDQAAEYARYGDTFFDALLALDDEKYREARAGFEALLGGPGEGYRDGGAGVPTEGEEGACYLYLAHATVCTLLDDDEAALASYTAFLEALPEGQGGDRRLLAHMRMAAIYDRLEDPDAALQEYQTAIEDFPDDYRPFLFMGERMRRDGHAEEALEMLRMALENTDGNQPDWQLLQELGFALADTGEVEAAVKQLDGVLQMFMGRGSQRPALAVRKLAELHELKGRFDRAADMWRILADLAGSPDRAAAHGEVARLVAAMGLEDEAQRMLKRGIALAKEAEQDDVAGALNERLALLADS